MKSKKFVFCRDCSHASVNEYAIWECVEAAEYKYQRNWKEDMVVTVGADLCKHKNKNNNCQQYQAKFGRKERLILGSMVFGCVVSLLGICYALFS